MAKKKLLEEIKQRPSRFYRLPGGVARDRRFGDAERLEILHAWRDEAEGDLAPKIDQARIGVESRGSSEAGHAAE